MSIRWAFWMPFDESFGKNGGVGITVSVPSLRPSDAMDEANRSTLQTVELLDGDCAGLGVYFATDEPFSLGHIAEVECDLDNEGCIRLANEDDSDFFRRVEIFLTEHPYHEEDDLEPLPF